MSQTYALIPRWTVIFSTGNCHSIEVQLTEEQYATVFNYTANWLYPQVEDEFKCIVKRNTCIYLLWFTEELLDLAEQNESWFITKKNWVSYYLETILSNK